MSVQPLKDFVVVRKEEAPKQTASGLYMPATTEEKVVTGVVLSVGPGRLTDAGVNLPVAVKVGDRVAFNKSFAVEVKDNGEVFHLLKEDQLLCVLN
jgi:chaperonin GroES